MSKKNQVTLGRILVAIVFFAGALACYCWVRNLLAAQVGPDQLVAALVFGIPTLVLGGIACLASSFRSALVVSGAVFSSIILLACITNAVVPLLK